MMPPNFKVMFVGAVIVAISGFFAPKIEDISTIEIMSLVGMLSGLSIASMGCGLPEKRAE